ncbi:MAG TPA: hypothetical protein PLD23_15030, partial [Armatimonadota bacterium]|nr:hypothetical protein [Armatimonadota bacterium]
DGWPLDEPNRTYGVGILGDCCTHGAGLAGSLAAHPRVRVVAGFEKDPRRGASCRPCATRASGACMTFRW